MTNFFTRVLIYVMLFLPCFIINSAAQNSDTKTMQNSFVIHGKLTNEQITFYTKSILAANMEQFRLKTQTVTLKFKNGFLLELTSAKELMLKNTQANININNYIIYDIISHIFTDNNNNHLFYQKLLECCCDSA